jgi:hypothetical protein
MRKETNFLISSCFLHFLKTDKIVLKIIDKHNILNSLGCPIAEVMRNSFPVENRNDTFNYFFNLVISSFKSTVANVVAISEKA